MFRRFIGMTRFFGATKKLSNEKLSADQVQRIEKLLKSPGFTKETTAKRYLINDEITYEKDLRIIDWNDRLMKDISTLSEAKLLAQEQMLDVVLVTENPPTVKLMNYSKLLLKTLSTQHTSDAKKDINNEFKAFKFDNTNITSHDLSRKIARIEKTLDEGFKVSIEIVIPGDTEAEIDRCQVLAENICVKIKEEMSDKIRSINKVENEDENIKIYIIPQVDMAKKKEVEEIVKDKEIYQNTGNGEYQKRALNKIKTYEKLAHKKSTGPDEEEDKYMEMLLDDDSIESKVKHIEEDVDSTESLRLSMKSFDIEEEEQGSSKNEGKSEKYKKILGDKLSYSLKKGRVRF
ncbi:unnamed protein product [Blepharisma stoltei]|uniref:Translation initiation factor 3 N-terminal domain-containing protein n=1 Tax=Blepharisma stoltei TaxID=1481888 RepID=A0AAU9ITB9_9CILI|nr:unnamed protein product [Blepharisma stoltei]